jgi:signal transduction histidine kinase
VHADRARLYDEDTRDTLRWGAPLVSLLLLAEGAAHLSEYSPSFSAAILLAAVLVAPLGWLAHRRFETRVPIRYWPLWIWLVCLGVLAFHVQPFNESATTYLVVALLFGCAALIIEPLAFGVSAGTLGLILVLWISRGEQSSEIRVFALACIPLALAFHWARRRSLMLGERQRELERELARQRDEMDTVRRVLGMNRGLTEHFVDVFSGIVHGTARALEQLDTGHPARAQLAAALASGEHGSEIIERLGLAGRDAEEPFTELEVSDLFGTPQAAGLIPARCDFDVATAPELPPLWAQRRRLGQALQELVANAVEAIGDQPGAIRIEVGAGARDGCIDIVVIDSGEGMSEAVISRCFEPFYTTRTPSRRGLGLAFVLGVVERHGGTLSIDSRPGRGTRVRLSLPASPERAPASSRPVRA